MIIPILLAIWNFLVALGPLLTAFGTAAIGVVAALWEVAKITAVITLITVAIELLFDPKGKARVGNFVYNLVGGGLGMAQRLLIDLAPELQQIVKAFADSFQRLGPSIRDTVAGPIGDLAADNFAVSSTNLTLGGESSPDNAIDQAIAAYRQAYGFGVSSAAITAAFESLFPEKLNVLNGVGPTFAQMAGFEEISSSVLEPLYENAFGKSLEYKYRAAFKPEYADEADAVKWFSRRIMNETDLREVFGVSGLKAKYEQFYVDGAYRPVPPFLLARAAEAGAIPQGDLVAALQFGGFRDKDITMLETAYAALALIPYQTAYLSAAKRSVELGTDTMANLVRTMADMGLSSDQQIWVQLEVTERKIEQLAELYRRSVSNKYRYGQISDADYIPSLEAIGIEFADAQAHYAIDSSAKEGRDAAAALKAEERLAAAQMRAATQAAIAAYRAFEIDAAELDAALLAAGVDPEIASYSVATQTSRRDGSKVLIYGLELDRPQALVLREKVAAIKEQAIKKLSTQAAQFAELDALGIPGANAQALVAEWQAQADKISIPA